MNSQIQDIVWNIDKVLAIIQDAPQTYETILATESKNRTLWNILSRKLNNLVKEGKLHKCLIPATRYGHIMFFCLPKPYTLLFESTRFGCNIYYFFKYDKINKFYILVDTTHQLINGVWVRVGEKKFFKGNVLKML